MRYELQFRQTPAEIRGLMVPTQASKTIPLTEITDISSVTGPNLIYRDDNRRFIAVKFSIRDREMGSTIAEAQQKMDKSIKLAKGYRIEWAGEFENLVWATKRLTQVVPVSLALISSCCSSPSATARTPPWYSPTCRLPSSAASRRYTSRA